MEELIISKYPSLKSHMYTSDKMSVEPKLKPSSAKSKKDKRGNSVFVVFLLLLIAGVFIRMGLNNDHDDSWSVRTRPGVPGQSNEYEERVNFHLSHTQTIKDVREGNIKIDNQLKAPSLRSTKEEVPVYDQSYTVDETGENYNDLVGRDLNKRKEFNYKDPVTLEDKINQEVINSDLRAAQDEAERQKYIQQFVENARRDGYELKVDAEGRVLSVKQIKRANPAPSIYDLSNGVGSK